MKAMTSKNIAFTFQLCLLLAVSIVGRTQGAGETNASADSLKVFTQQVQAAYAKAAYLSFSVKYLYANAGQPGKYIDSLLGEVQMNAGRSRIIIDSIETVLTDKYAIHVVKDDKLIYLAAAVRGAGENPVGMLDSAFSHIKGITTHLYHRDGAHILILDFPAGQAYTRMEISIDDRTGFFQRIGYSINTAGYVGREMIETPDHPAPYESKGRVVILFSDYKKGGFDDRVFQTDKFFTRTAGRYEPAGQYKDYRIYLASSNL
jgi:hypothetical protein